MTIAASPNAGTSGTGGIPAATGSRTYPAYTVLLSGALGSSPASRGSEPRTIHVASSTSSRGSGLRPTALQRRSAARRGPPTKASSASFELGRKSHDRPGHLEERRRSQCPDSHHCSPGRRPLHRRVLSFTTTRRAKVRARTEELEQREFVQSRVRRSRDRPPAYFLALYAFFVLQIATGICLALDKP